MRQPPTAARRAPGRAALARSAAALAAPAALAAAVLIAGAPATAPAAKLRTTSVGVGLREYRIALYRARVLPGRVRLNIENLGEDGHDVRITGPGASLAVRAASPEIKAGKRLTLTATLRTRGLYTLVCTIGDHSARGMVARLRVVRKL